MRELRLGIAGLGTVAQGVLQILRDNGELLSARSGLQIRVTRVASRTAKPEVDLGGAHFSTQLADLLSDDVDVVVELIGGETHARTLITDALAAGKRVVTANKALIANHGNELLAAKQVVPLRYEAAVAGAIPIVTAIREALVANRFRQLVGIINGTCNYILTAMQENGTSFADALQTAQQLGYAEADPTFDVDGIDAAHKLAILTGLAFDCAFNFDAIYVEGIRKISVEDMRYAAELGYRIKHVAIAKQTRQGIEARVHPALIPAKQLFAGVNDVANAVLVQSDAAGQTLYSGPGAGALATASSVLGDVVAIADMPLDVDVTRRVAKPFVELAAVEAANYLRIPVRDEAGVFAKVAQVLSTQNISIEAAIQKEPHADQDIVHIVMITSVCSEAAMCQAIEDLQAESVVAGELARIRVESLGE